jgi:diguanylate cyclase (GGDEF)-like protein
MKTTQGADRAYSNAVILLWQTRYRLLIVAAVGGITIAFKWAGMLSADSIAAIRFGTEDALVYTVALLIAYSVFIGAIAIYLRRKRRVGTWAVFGTLIADIVLFNGQVLLSTPPEHYARALILATFTVQMTLMYFGWRAGAWNLIGVIAGYLAILLVASTADPAMHFVEGLWTLGLFTVGLTAFLTLQADLGDRLANVVQIFDRAREGDFSLTFDEETSEHPDRITVIGAAYNKMRTQLTSIILTDPLTGCFNPRGFDQLAAREVSRAARAHAALSVLAVDIDHFKDINDTYGHLAGDEVLREIGVILRNTARLSDVVARTGGEEFAILAPETDDAGATLFAQRLLDAFRTHKFAAFPDRKVTVSVGLAVAPARTDGVLRLLRARADEALYVAKRSGRDRTECWREGKATRASELADGN